MSNIILFQFESNHIRTGDLDGNPVFCLSDLLTALNSKTTIGDAKLAISDVFGEGYVINLPLETTTGIQDAVFVFESGLTFLISRSRTEKGKRMNRWIHSEVLPSIRKTGSYSIAPEISVPKPLLIEQSKTVAQNVIDIQQLLGGSQPRLAQLLIDIGVNDFVESNQPKLAASQEFPEDRWYSLVSIAEKMGIKTNSSTRTSMGLSVGKKGLERVREERLCNGEMRPIWCYRDNADTRQAIDEWADSLAEI